MLIYLGPPVYTESRLSNLLKKLQLKDSRITKLDARYCYFVQPKAAADAALGQSLQGLLPECAPIESELTLTSEQCLIVPRMGTISPWSSKATEIAKICDFAVERIERGILLTATKDAVHHLDATLFDPMTQSVIYDPLELAQVFAEVEPVALATIPVLAQGREVLEEANVNLGLALSDAEIDYLLSVCESEGCDPTDVELMMFAQVNSEHCRHKIFNARWIIDGVEQDHSLFQMIRNTHKLNPKQALVAYKDNAAVLRGRLAKRFFANPESRRYASHDEETPFVLKVETHNHPTAISPFPGAATGSGGEIRDEAATGRGAYPKMGLCGFSVSQLQIPGYAQPWEIKVGHRPHTAHALEIMTTAPIGAASFNNEFGRPNVCGYFRTLTINDTTIDEPLIRGYHKPIMIAGGVGNIRPMHVHKQTLPVGAKLVVLGGPAMAIGLGGGSASSLSSGQSHAELDFASVQRSNPEMERRAQEVINTCWALGDDNPILSIHDVGAGGLSNALPELVESSERGAEIHLRKIPNMDWGMSPQAIWCNEAQERYVLAITSEDEARFAEIAKRERCPFAIVGDATLNEDLVVADAHFSNDAVRMPLAALFGDLPRTERRIDTSSRHLTPLNFDTVLLKEAIDRVLHHPTVADKGFLITIGDRSVTGLIARDQMVGRWQVPVADVAVSAIDYVGYHGEAMAMGERTPVAMIDSAAAARLAVGEAITNIAAAKIDDLSNITLSANWMADAHRERDAADLYEAVKAVGMELCPELKIAIPVGKDSLSMRSSWQADDEQYTVSSPVSLIITAAASVSDVRQTLTPEIQALSSPSLLLLIDLGEGRQALGASILAQTYQQIGDEAPDVRSPLRLSQFFSAIQTLNKEQLIHAYHDRSDGGVLATLLEMSFASHSGLEIELDCGGDEVLPFLFNEELGAVIQVADDDLDTVLTVLKAHDLNQFTHIVARINERPEIKILHRGDTIFKAQRTQLHRAWSETSFRMRALRDNPNCAQQEYDALLDESDIGLSPLVLFDPHENVSAPFIHLSKPKVAILREQGVNGHVEMAAAFHLAGFESVDVHMSELLAGTQSLKDCQGLVACGGFSYGDVLGAGRGWAQSILLHDNVRAEFAAFFERQNTFSLGVCNGCQMMAYLKDIIPGAAHWPLFLQNQSEQFEARLVQVKITQSPSILFQGMAGSVLPVVVAHGEGRVIDASDQLVAMHYVDAYHRATENYPANPNGSAAGVTGYTSEDGRATIIMPHPERIFRTVQVSWHPNDWGAYSPWMRMFRNVRRWVG